MPFAGVGIHTARHFRVTKLDGYTVIVPKWRLIPEDIKLLREVWKEFWVLCSHKEMERFDNEI